MVKCFPATRSAGPTFPLTEEAALRAASSVDGCGAAVEAAEAAEAPKTSANAYENSESLGLELYTQATAGQQESGK